MSTFENPNTGRARFYEDGDLFQVRVASESQPFATIFSAFWLCGWAIGEISVIGSLLSGGQGAGALFLLAWLGGWTVGGLAVLSQVLWNVGGYELLTLSGDALTIERHIPFYRRRWVYDPGHITDVRAEAAVPRALLRSNMGPGVFSKASAGAVVLHYGVRQVGFGLGLELPEAQAVAERVQQRLGGE